MISESKICAFVGPVENLWKLEAKHLWGNKFRINVWIERSEEDMYCQIHEIDKSYFVEVVDGEIIDKTIKSNN